MSRTDTAVIAEIHVDDLALETGANWQDARRLVATIAELANGAGAQLSFRFRRGFSEEAARLGAQGPLAELEAAGHEVGTHAHGRGLRKAQCAVSACGVANRVATPGMVQAGDRVGRIWQQAASLGFAWITDHPPHSPWTYGGILPWRPGPRFRPDEPPLGPVMIETSADPFAWGLLRRDGRRVAHEHRLGPEQFGLLEGLFDAHHRTLPHAASPYFSFALHEHNLCAAGSLQPRPQALDALEAFLRAHRVVPSGELVDTFAEPPLLPANPERRGLRLARRVRMATRPARRTLRGRPALGPGPFSVTSGPRQLHALWLGPTEPRGVLLLAHAGLRGGTRSLLRPFGLDPAALTARGLAVVAYDRSGTGRSPAKLALTPGSAAHVRDFRSVLTTVRQRLAPGTPLGVLSFSSAIIPVLRCGEPFDFLIDGEAPADRWSLRPPRWADTPSDPAMAALDMNSDEAWRGREPARLLAGHTCPYHRLQAELDHVHGRMSTHAQIMLEAARSAGLPRVQANGAEVLSLLPGRLHAHSRRIEGWIAEAFDRVLD